MKLEEIVAAVDGKLLVDPPLELEVQYGFASDLMGDVLNLVRPQTLLITGLADAQSVRTAEMADLPAILFARGNLPSAETLDLARQKGIAVVASPYTMFDICGLLFQAGLFGLGKAKQSLA